MRSSSSMSRLARSLAASTVAAATLFGGLPAAASAQEAPTTDTPATETPATTAPAAEATSTDGLATLTKETNDGRGLEKWRAKVGGYKQGPMKDKDGNVILDESGKPKQDFILGETEGGQKYYVFNSGSKDPRVSVYQAKSPSMNGRSVPLVVIHATEPNRPTLYVLNGGDGGEGSANWIMQTPMIEFYKEKNINVVVPMEGKFSYYSDWVTDKKNLGGKQMWETFLTKELPPVIEKELQANGKRAITGMSMSATTVLLYAQHHPGFYDAIGSFSGCAQTTKDMGLIAINLTLDRASSNVNEMWGNGEAFQPGFADAPIDNYLQYNDALINAEKLRGQTMYISNASGLSGRWDYWSSPRTKGNSAAMAEVEVVGGVIEGATNYCTHQLKAKLDKAGIPAEWNFRPTGTHQWGYWEDDMHLSWPTLAKGMGIGDEVTDEQ
ncbi:alpha/beta hydrolase [Corynebacterium pyruviciproducens]|uniref:alpha/beta hydrolase n=1 Tax=Corynebacterium pyruviciproducens TaxID=598660 RepID=UPI0023F25238|nr:alpha/beta hydrolase family protein [Corynebacterium pyruviciproducens]